MPFAAYSPWRAGYAPASYGYTTAGYGGYGYATAGYGGNCCDTGCGVYSASYQGYGAVSYGNSGCNSCGDCCSGTCGNTFSQSMNYGGGSDCIGTESRKVPEPDTDYNKDAPVRNYGPDDELDKEDGFGTLEPSQPRSGTEYETETERRRRLDRESQERLERDRVNPDRWSPTDPSPAPTDRSQFERPAPAGRGTDDDFRSPNPVDNSRFPEPFDGIGGGNKPPMPDPSDIVPPVDQSVRKPAMPPIEAGVEAEETSAEDFLPPEPAADARTSHADVLKMPRLAEHTRSKNNTKSKVSSSQSKQTPARWISLPLPAGRARS